MYPNLDAEMARRGLKRKDLACMFRDRAATVSDKLNGKSPFLLDEVFRIKENFFPECDIEYLFDTKKDTL
ncbi:XRE family transcriptional regulator [Metabacillus bambusae]|uniref:XRE family transcriptional regulator n=1 Tax=Metabacillus bambusae TaxID=2795218 RepID=A0ABS3N4L6_9BACI|nr:XRE family transcriptional regulator [Metabacillus bambusae]MBO1513225.1 XRE family transcriptional regulator [Metabacillus bambusae]